MENTLRVALSSQDGLRRQLAVVANNIANMNTTGFKGEKMMFTQHLVRSKGGEKVFGDKIAYVRDIATVRDTTEGPMTATGNTLDFAIGGEGFFVVNTAGGERYTRNGSFKLNEAGQMVTQTNDPVLSDSGQPFIFGPRDTEINVSRDGVVSTENGELGRMRVVRFDNEQQLRMTSAGLYAADSTPQNVTKPDVVQNMIEASNVQPIIEITRMIELNKAYSAAQKFLDREDERIQKMVQEFARVA